MNKLDMSKELKPCPCCGNEYPWEFIGAWTAVLRCKCGIEVNGSAVRTVYKKDDIPAELEPFAHPAERLTVKTEEGDKRWPEHGYYGVSVTASFHHFGFADIWNRRPQPPEETK